MPQFAFLPLLLSLNRNSHFRLAPCLLIILRLFPISSYGCWIDLGRVIEGIWLDLRGGEREDGFGCFEGLSRPALMLEGSNRPRAIPGMFVEASCMAWNNLMAQIFHIGPTFGFSPYLIF